MIAAIAIAHDAMLVTNNTREFSRIGALNHEDWE
jgi:predicted nucleic acid-binding protein